jgi:DNA-binding NarL/FixJ family response regulator
VTAEIPSGNCVCHRTAAAALRDLRCGPVRLALIGLSLPDLDGLDVVEVIASERLAWRILVVRDRDDEHSPIWLRRARVDGVFDPWLEPVSRLHEAIRQVVAGGRYFSAAAHAALSAPMAPTLHQLMTPHEQLVFAAIGAGCDDSVAAERLAMAPETVHWHRQRIMRKLGVQSRGELMREALRRGVVRIVDGAVLRPGFERALAARRAAQGATSTVAA